MNLGVSAVYRLASRFSRISVTLVIVIFTLLYLAGIQLPISLQIVIATLSLALGIPHGAVDHLISIPAHPRSRFVSFIIIYSIIALIAGYGIAQWNVHGFQFVLIMSALHFGYGDSAFRNEWQDSIGGLRVGILSENLYALAAGTLPVFLPLTDHRSLSALARIHPTLGDWAGSYAHIIRNSTVIFAALAIIILLLSGHTSSAIDLLLLIVLSLLAPPLITFAIYFGCWHALRHTARLVPKLPKALTAADGADVGKAILRAVFPGLYALVGTLLIGAGLMIFAPDRFGSGLLWSTLVVVWALTVPHMMATARFDWKALKKRI
jgi:Brp/Blh family beta-carotene 15,15'-monooxygenase